MSGGNGKANGGNGPIDRAGRSAADGDPMRAARASMRQELPRRFYRSVAAGPVADGDGHVVLLDGRAARTPRKRTLLLPTVALADAVAAEWAAQIATIDPAAMPLTRLANTALDGVTGRETEVRADIARYAGSDLLCYRAERPAGLVVCQAAQWDPVLAWAGGFAGAPFEVQRGIVHLPQRPAALDGIVRALAPLAAFELTAIHAMTTLTGSALLALAVHAGRIDGEAAWAAAHVDEDWQIAEWGEDREAAERRALRKLEMDAAARMTRLLVATR